MILIVFNCRLVVCPEYTRKPT